MFVKLGSFRYLENSLKILEKLLNKNIYARIANRRSFYRRLTDILIKLEKFDKINYSALTFVRKQEGYISVPILHHSNNPCAEKFSNYSKQKNLQKIITYNLCQQKISFSLFFTYCKTSSIIIFQLFYTK